MTLNLTIKQLNELIITYISDVKFHTIDKHYLIVVKSNSSKHLFKLITVLEIQEIL